MSHYGTIGVRPTRTSSYVTAFVTVAVVAACLVAALLMLTVVAPDPPDCRDEDCSTRARQILHEAQQQR